MISAIEGKFIFYHRMIQFWKSLSLTAVSLQEQNWLIEFYEFELNNFIAIISAPSYWLILYQDTILLSHGILLPAAVL